MSLVQRSFFVTWALLLALMATATEQPLNPAQLQTRLNQVVQKVIPATVEVRRGNGAGTFSAVIVSPEGYLLSAGHAVQPGVAYDVFLPDGRTFKATGLGSEPHVDMGLIKIDQPNNLPVAEMGWSSTLEVNEPCISLGYPGLRSEQRGVVVRFGHIVDTATDDGFIQSTCLMEPGDSGGPLYDMAGRVIGIHSNIGRSLDRNHEIPVDQFRRYWPHLLRKEEFHDHDVDLLPEFGFDIAEPEESTRHRRWLGGAEQTATVVSVDLGGLADDSGLRTGDRLLAIGREEAKYPREVKLLLQRAYTRKQSEVAVQVKRGGHTVNLSLQLPENTQPDDGWNQGIAVIQQPLGVNKVAPQPQLINLQQVFSVQEKRMQSSTLSLSSVRHGEIVNTLATVLHPGNLLISKSSRVGENVTFERNGERYSATVVDRDSNLDLVLLKLPMHLRGGIRLPSNGRVSTERGQLLISPHPENNGLVSVVSTGEFAIAKRQSAGYLGVAPNTVGNRVRLERVFPDTPASGQFLDGDFLLTVDGESVKSAQQLIETLRRYAPGDKIILTALRNTQPISVELVLGVRPNFSGHVAEFFEGGKSIRRDGFEAVFSHDARLRPEACGGPVFTANGDFVGINIARYSRTRAYAIPAKQVVDFVNKSI
ncbi:trypsin-like peptidase domain-containing protein [bacterium SCSIO 12696]|nr:trypsin-like peptidase domain-containing protein [bacterium SCSIO 12696]